MDISYLQTDTSTSDLTTYTFSSQNLGTADAGRYIVVCVSARNTAGSLTVSSVSVGGVSASSITQITNSGSNHNVAAIAICAVPSGTTGDIVVTFAAGALRCVVNAYRLVDIDSATPSDTVTSIANDPTGALDVPAGGAAIGVSNSGTGATATSWTGITEDYDAVTESMEVSSAHDLFVSEQSGLTILADITSPSNSAGVFASWAPAGAPPAGGNVPYLATGFGYTGIANHGTSRGFSYTGVAVH